MAVKPAWLRRLHVIGLHGHPQVNCPLCKQAAEEASRLPEPKEAHESGRYDDRVMFVEPKDNVD